MIVISFRHAKNTAHDIQSSISSLPFGESENTRLGGMKNQTAKEESLSALLALKTITESLNDTFDMTVLRESNGKPYFANSSMKFSLSHSCGLSVAVLSDTPIGIDIEHIDKSRKIYSLADKYFSAEEIDLLNKSLSPYEDFYRIWTKKEAVSKINGEGISMLIAAKKEQIKIDFFKQYKVDFNNKQYILSICLDKFKNDEIIFLPYKELDVYGIQN